MKPSERSDRIWDVVEWWTSVGIRYKLTSDGKVYRDLYGDETWRYVKTIRKTTVAKYAHEICTSPGLIVRSLQPQLLLFDDAETSKPHNGGM